MRTDWIQTYSGNKFYPAQPHPGDVCIEDIAHALSNICRFNGHTKTFYSVAQHSVLVSKVMEEKFVGENDLIHVSKIRDALLHDAAEAYLGDIVRPVKMQLGCIAGKEKMLQECIYNALELILPAPVIKIDIKRADNILLVTEARDLLDGSPDWSTMFDVQPLEKIITPWQPAIAKDFFLRCWEELKD